jgi:hypothetical protein
MSPLRTYHLPLLVGMSPTRMPRFPLLVGMSPIRMPRFPLLVGISPTRMPRFPLLVEISPTRIPRLPLLVGISPTRIPRFPLLVGISPTRMPRSERSSKVRGTFYCIVRCCVFCAKARKRTLAEGSATAALATAKDATRKTLRTSISKRSFEDSDLKSKLNKEASWVGRELELPGHSPLFIDAGSTQSHLCVMPRNTPSQLHFGSFHLGLARIIFRQMSFRIALGLA